MINNLYFALFSLFLFISVRSALFTCTTDADCSTGGTNGLCYDHPTLDDKCLCNSGFGDDGISPACDTLVPNVGCVPEQYNSTTTNFSPSVSASMSWIGGATDILRIVVTIPYQESVNETLVLFASSGETLCDFPYGDARAGTDWSVSAADASCAQTLTADLQFSTVAAVSPAASPDAECFTIAADPAPGVDQIWTATMIVKRLYQTDFAGDTVYPVEEVYYDLALTFPSTATFTDSITVTIPEITDQILFSQTHSAGTWTWTLKTQVQWPLEIDSTPTFSPTTIDSQTVTLSGVAKDSCSSDQPCVQTTTFTLASTAPQTALELDVDMTLVCRAGETCDGFTPQTFTVRLVLNLPDLSPSATVQTSATAVTTSTASYESSFVGSAQDSFLPGETIYMVISMTQQEGTEITSAQLQNDQVSVTGTGGTYGPTGVTVAFDQTYQTLNVSILIPTPPTAPWPTTSDNGSPNSVAIAGNIEYTLGSFKRQASQTYSTRFGSYVTMSSVPAPTDDGFSTFSHLSLVLIFAALAITILF